MTAYRMRLLALVALFLLGAYTQGRVLPVLEGGDEWLQLAYVEHLRATGTLPDRALNETGPVRQQSGQPPLTYALSALAPAALNLPPVDTWAMMEQLQRDSNNWFTPPDKFNRRDNNNVFYLANEPAQNPRVVAVMRAVRWIAPVYGVVGVVAMAGAAWEVFRDGGWVLTAAAVFAFTPTYLHVNSFLTTDGGAAALGTVTLWLALVIARRGVTWRRSLAVGVALGLAGLAKVSTLLLAPAVGVAVMIGARRRIPVIIKHGALIAVPLALTFGVWAAWGWFVYGDPLGTDTHRFPGQYFDPPLGVGAVLARLPEVYLSYWGKFGSAVYLHPATYAALTGVLVLAGIGYVFGRRAWHAIPLRVMGVISVAAAVIFAGVWYWVATINFITGRLMFPAHGALVLLVTGGVYALAQRIPRADVFLRALLVIPVAVAGLVIAPMAIHTAYTPPRPLADNLPELNATVYDFGESMRLLGWRTDETALTPGELYTVTLCWRVLQPTDRAAAYSFRLVRDGVPIGERTTVHGLGRYGSRQWTAGYTFCDALDVPIHTAEPGVTYDMLLVMLDAQTGAVDWQATTPDGVPVQFPVLGQVNGSW